MGLRFSVRLGGFQQTMRQLRNKPGDRANSNTLAVLLQSPGLVFSLNDVPKVWLLSFQDVYRLDTFAVMVAASMACISWSPLPLCIRIWCI
jgi:hypothetical protein